MNEYLLKEDGYKLLLENGGGILLDFPLELSASCQNSDYKWLSATLKQSQLGPAYTPYFKLQILDDTINPLAKLTNPNVPVLGEAVTAPDGNILMAGGDGSGNLRFWKISNAGNPIPTGTLLVSSGSGYIATLNTSIAVSNWINGSYVIDIFYYATSSGNPIIQHARSSDGGNTWSILPYAISTTLLSSNNNYVAAGQPIYDPVNQVTKATCFYIRGSQGVSTAFYKICYQQWDGGSAFGGEVQWSRSTDSQDWTLHSLGVQYLNGSYYIFFSGYHNWYDIPSVSTLTGSQNNNYNVYMVRLDNITNNQATDTWQLVRDILIANSSQSTNQNSFTFPRISFDGSMYYLVFNAVVGEGLTTAGAGTNQIGTLSNNYYYMLQSADLTNFTYPLPIFFTDGTVYADTAGVSFVNQGSYYYLLGNGQNWQYLKNNIFADISNAVINYQIQELAGASNQITIEIGNANNQWIGSSPTGVGASAIAINKKIILEQGYVTSVGNEVVPRGIFYIDTITLNSSANNNTATIVGRDINRNLQNVSTKFSYSRLGTSYYNDLFDGTTLQNWNQVGGTWIETNVGGYGGGVLEEISNAPSSSTPYVISQPDIVNDQESSIIFTLIPINSSIANDTMDIYPLYQDSNNYFKVSVGTDSSYNFVVKLNLMIGGLNTNLGSSTVANAGTYPIGVLHPVMIRKYNYHTFDILIGANLNGTGNTYSVDILDLNGAFSPLYSILGIELDSYFTSTSYLVKGNVALGYYTSYGFYANFRLFKYFEFNESLSLQEAMEYLCAIAGITNFKEKTVFFDNHYSPSNYSSYFNTYSIVNGYLQIQPLGEVININNLIGNGEIEFLASASPVISGLGFGFNFFFRYSSNFQNAYFFKFAQSSSGVVHADLWMAVNGVSYQLISTSYSPGYNNIPIDITKQHLYRIAMIDQVFYLFIDERLYLMWQDTNYTVNPSLPSGYWGMQATSNSVLTIGNFTSYALYNQISNVTFNTGDDMTSNLQNLLEIVYAYSYVDQIGRYVGTVLNSIDLTTYTYQNLLYNLQVQNSTSSVINEVIVTGNNVLATYKNTALIALTGQVRSENITDYTIETYQDALTRAMQELLNANRLTNQNNPANPMNVGSELFDVITLINTGNNSTSINGNFRIFNETFTLDGAKGQYSIQIETGSL